MFLPVGNRARGVAATEGNGGRRVNVALRTALDIDADGTGAADVDRGVVGLHQRSATAGAVHRHRTRAGGGQRGISPVKRRALFDAEERRVSGGDVKRVVVVYVDQRIRAIGKKTNLIAAGAETGNGILRDINRGVAARVHANRAVAGEVNRPVHVRCGSAAALTFHPNAKVARAAGRIGSARHVDGPGGAGGGAVTTGGQHFQAGAVNAVEVDGAAILQRTVAVSDQHADVLARHARSAAVDVDGAAVDQRGIAGTAD